MSNLHLRPFAPHLSKFVDCLEIDLCRLQEDFASVIDVLLRFTRCPAFLVELGEIDV